MIYQIQCPKCGVVDAEAPIKDGPPKKCPKCKAAAKPVIGAPAFHARLSPMHPRANRGRGW